LNRRVSHPPLFAAALLLTGCWTAPVATVQPHGEARLIQGAIAVKSVKDTAVVSSLERSAGTIVLRSSARPETSTYKLAPKVSGLDDIKAGDVVQATVTEDLTIYALHDGQLPDAGGTVSVDARVLMVDPGYRLLTLQYPDGQKETFKVPLGTRLEQMEPGDSVVIQPLEVLALRRRG
jgi:hypothetical protein